MNTHRIRRALWGFSLLTVAILGSPAPAGSPQDTQRPDDETHRRLREANRQALAGLAKDLEKPEWRPHDLGAWVERVGRDPARLVASVQKEIRFEPYPGLQRGPAGTLVAGSGNALDKSFLLMELLRAIGCEARMVKGTLSPEKAGDLVKAAIAGINSRPAGRFRGPFGGGEVRKEQADSMARRTGLSAEPLLRLLRMEEEERRAYLQTVRLKQLCASTIVDKARLERALSVIRSRGYDFSQQERHQGAWGLAAPILNEKELAIGSIAITGIRFRLPQKKLPRFISLLKEAAGEVSGKLKNGRAGDTVKTRRAGS